MTLRSHVLPGLEWGLASRAFGGERRSGDQCVVRQVGAGLLVAVVDGLGHGPEAVRAAERVCVIIERARDLDLATIVRHCHAGLRDARGVVMTLVALDPRTDSLTWLGVGNISGHLLRAPGHPSERRDELFVRGGTIGVHLPMLLPSASAVQPGDLIVIGTDGLRPGFSRGIASDEAPQTVAEGILARHARETDDALVFVGRYVGRQATAA